VKISSSQSPPVVGNALDATCARTACSSPQPHGGDEAAGGAGAVAGAVALAFARFGPEGLEWAFKVKVEIIKRD
jgi:hypothetical protein